MYTHRKLLSYINGLPSNRGLLALRGILDIMCSYLQRFGLTTWIFVVIFIVLFVTSLTSLGKHCSSYVYRTSYSIAIDLMYAMHQ